MINNYYSFKIFPRFWLVRTTCIIHHNQLLFSKFGKNLRHIESMTSKVQPVENYWINDVKMTSKVQPPADYWTVDRKNLGTRLCYIWWEEKQRAKWRNSFKNEEIFWMNNKAITEVDFRRIWRILQISEGVIHLGLRPLWITPSLICRILHILLSLIQYIYYMATIVRALWLAAERALFPCNDRALWNLFSARRLFWVVSKTTCAWAKTMEKMDKSTTIFSITERKTSIQILL